MRIQAVFFDMGGTIDTYGFTPDLRLARTPGIQSILMEAGINLGLKNQDLYEVISEGLLRYKTWSLKSEKEISSARVWSDYIFPDYDLDQDLLASIAEDLMVYIETQYFERNLRPEVPAVLESLKDMGYKIGLISNVNSKGQVPKNLAEYKISDYFDPLVLSSVYGYRKPDPSIFHYAANLAGVPASQCLHLGDRITRDVLGAQRAGFGLTVQINHIYNHRENDIGATPDFVIDQMTELLDILTSVQYPPSAIPEIAGKDTNRIQALIFDAGDVLYYRKEKGLHLYQYLEKLNISPEDGREEERYALRQQAFRGEITQREYQIAGLRLYGIDQPELIAQGLDAIKKDEDNVQFFDGVRETLICLKEQGYLLGILTDTANSVHTKLSWFEKGGIGNLWDSFTSSMMVGVRKPHPGMYQAALDQLCVTASEALFVGHKITELKGARAVGMKTIAFNPDPGAKADFYAEKFADILDIQPLSSKKESLIGN